MKKEKRVLTLHEKELKREKRIGIIVTTIIIIFLSILSLAQIFPFYLQIVTSLQPTDFTPIDGKIYLWPVKICFENYKTAFIEGDLLVGLKNTLIVALGFIFLSGLIILIVGYVLAKKEFRGKKIISSSISNPLTTIYNTLKKGQPIMVGLKDKSGNQHYVVVYGFTGGNTLSSNSFLIRDPGSSSRTKLNELLAIKPIYYKIITIK